MREGRWHALGVMAVVACTQSEVAPTGPKSTCAQDLFHGFETPERAFETYAAALNEKDYCRAANTYVRDQRGDVALASLSALALTAAEADPAQLPAYRSRFQKICATYKLSCEAEARVPELARGLRAGKPIQTLEPKLVELAKQVPEDLFAAVMTTLAAVDPKAIGKLSPTLENLTVQGDRANARAKREGRPATPVLFTRFEQGWLLVLH